MIKKGFIYQWGALTWMCFLSVGYGGCGTVVNNPGDDEKPDETTKQKEPDNKSKGNPSRGQKYDAIPASGAGLQGTKWKLKVSLQKEGGR